MANQDWDKLEATAMRLRAMHGPVLAYDDGAPVLDPPEWVNEPPPPEPIKAEEPLPVLTMGELRAKSQAVQWLVKRVIPACSLGVLFGGSQSFKTFIAIDLAFHVAWGLKWLGRKTSQTPVLVISAEGEAGISRRIEAWHRLRGLTMDDCPARVIPVSVDLGTDCARVVRDVAAAGITPGLIIVDTLSQTFSGEENSAREVASYLREIKTWFRDGWQCTVIVIHHTGHTASERPRGSSVIKSNVDFMIGCFRDEKEMLATITCEKQKDGELFADQLFSMTVFDLDIDEDGEKITTLVSSAVMSTEEKRDIIMHESKRGRGGRNALILQIAQNGMRADELRKIFYDQCEGADTDARRQAYFRAIGWAKKAGLLEIVDGYVLLQA